MSDPVNFRGLNAVRLNNGSLLIRKDASRRIPDIVLIGRKNAELQAIVDIIANPPSYTRAALNEYFVGNNNIVLNISETNNPVFAGRALWPNWQNGQMISRRTSVPAGQEFNIQLRIDAQDFRTGPGGSANFDRLANFAIHEILHPYGGRHLFGLNPTMEQIRADRTFNFAFLDYKELVDRGSVGSGILLGIDASIIGETSQRDQLAERIRTVYFAAGGSGTDVPPPPRYYDPIDEFSSSFRFAGDAGRAIGSALGNYLFDGKLPLQIVGSAILSTIGQNLGQRIAAIGSGGRVRNVSGEVSTVLNNFQAEFSTNLAAAGVGTVSSLLSLELGRAIGTSGFGGELLNVGASSVISHVAGNVLAGLSDAFSGLASPGLFKSVPLDGAAGPGALTSVFMSFLGAKLGSLIISPTTKEGALFASIGSSVGALAGTSITLAVGKALGLVVGTKLGTFGNFIAPGVGALIGFVAGALIGKLFFGSPPKPWAAAEISLNLGTGFWDMGAVYAKHGASKDVVTSMALSARDSINGVIAMVGGREDVVGVANPVAEKHKYRWDAAQGDYEMQELVGSTFVKRYDGKDASAAVDIGVLLGIRDTLIVGGDLFMKRAILNYLPAGVLPTAEKDIITLLGNMQIAEDFGRYMRDPEPINRLMAANPNSAFTAAWAITLLRAEELELNRFQKSDFYGGMAGFIQSAYQTGETPSYESYSFYADDGWWLEGPRLGYVPGSYGDYLFISNNDIPRLGLNQLWSGAPYATGGNDLADLHKLVNIYGSNPTFDGGGGDDVVIGSYTNDTIFGSAGFDWLDGLDGNDKLNGGAGNDVLLGRAGADNLDGGDGDDYLSGGDGDDYTAGAWNRLDGGLWGGNGNDILTGGAGTDLVIGEAGDDTIIATDDGVWDYYSGEGGSDTLSFERFTYGVGIDLNSGRGQYWHADVRAIAGNNLWSIENLTGTAFNDWIYGDEIGNVLKGLGGNDHLYGREGDDILEGGAGADVLDGGAGIDTASYAGSTSGVYVDLGAGTAFGGDASGDSFISIENLLGSRFGDVLAGNAGNNQLRGGGGDDVLIASGGNDWMQGGDGFDAIDFSAATTSVIFSAPMAWSVSGWGTGTHDNTIEKLIGSNHADHLRTGAGDHELEGGAGNDQLYGGEGHDTYIFAPGHGIDGITDTAAGNNTLRFEGMNWRDLRFNGYQPWGGTSLTVTTMGGAGSVTVYNHFPSRNGDGTVRRNSGSTGAIIKGIDLGGAGLVEIGDLDYMPGQGDDAANYLYGLRNKDDLLFAYGGSDVIYTSGGGYETETRGNVVYAGDGADYIYGSTGDDQYIFERGNGIDTLWDTGGLDTIIMGPSIAAEDVSFAIVPVGGDGQANLEILVRDPANPGGPIIDKIIVVDGGFQTFGVYWGGIQPVNTIEYIRVGGQVINLMKLDIPWSTRWDYSMPPGGGHIPPLVLDLDGDGVELRSVHGSRLAAVAADGIVYRTGWVGPDDGILVLDRNGDGKIDRQSEISFTQDVEGARTDLEGLAAYDSNGDGKLSAEDARWGEFRVWRDLNQDGESKPRELMTLAEAGVKSISLTGKVTGQTPGSVAESAIVATAAIEWLDPARTGDAYDVVLALAAVRTDGGDDGVLEGHRKAEKRSGKHFSDNLFGTQALTQEQADALHARRKDLDLRGDELMFGRVEDILGHGSTRIEHGVWITDAIAKPKGGKGKADGLVDAGSGHAMANGDDGERYAADAWTLAGSQDARARLDSDSARLSAEAGALDEVMRPDMAPLAEAGADNAASSFWKAFEETREAETLRLADATTPHGPKLDAIPTGPLAGDLFRRLPADDGTAPVAEAKSLPEGLVRQGQQAANLSGHADQRGDHAPADSEPAAEPGPLTSLKAPAQEPKEPIADASVRNASATKPVAANDEQGYTARIEAANSALVQAMASFGAASRMMTMTSLAPSPATTIEPWMSVSALPSVSRMMGVA